MKTGRYEAAVHLDRPAELNDEGRNRWTGWRVVTTLLLAGFFVEAVLAGAMLSGVGWARAAHGVTAAVLIGMALAAGLVSLATLRRARRGPQLAVLLLALAAAAFLQTALGGLSAKGVNLLWLHVPLGVALVGLAAQVVTGARRLDGD